MAQKQSQRSIFATQRLTFVYTANMFDALKQMLQQLLIQSCPKLSSVCNFLNAQIAHIAPHFIIFDVDSVIFLGYSETEF